MNPSRAGRYAQESGNHRHHSCQGHGALGIPRRQRQNDREDEGHQRGVRPQHQHPARAEQRVGQQAEDGCVQTADGRHARRNRIRDTDRNEHGRQRQSGDDIVAQPGEFVMAQGMQARQPAHQTALRSDSPRVGKASGRRCLG